MKKIIKHGAPEITTRRFICTKCGCIFDADKRGYNVYFDRNERYCRSSCPECNGSAYEYEKSQN